MNAPLKNIERTTGEKIESSGGFEYLCDNRRICLIKNREEAITSYNHYKLFDYDYTTITNFSVKDDDIKIAKELLGKYSDSVSFEICSNDLLFSTEKITMRIPASVLHVNPVSIKTVVPSHYILDILNYSKTLTGDLEFELALSFDKEVLKLTNLYDTRELLFFFDL
jgi:hypothetical protein